MQILGSRTDTADIVHCKVSTRVRSQQDDPPED